MAATVVESWFFKCQVKSGQSLGKSKLTVLVHSHAQLPTPKPPLLLPLLLFLLITILVAFVAVFILLYFIYHYYPTLFISTSLLLFTRFTTAARLSHFPHNGDANRDQKQQVSASRWIRQCPQWRGNQEQHPLIDSQRSTQGLPSSTQITQLHGRR